MRRVILVAAFAVVAAGRLGVWGCATSSYDSVRLQPAWHVNPRVLQIETPPEDAYARTLRFLAVEGLQVAQDRPDIGIIQTAPIATGTAAGGTRSATNMVYGTAYTTSRYHASRARRLYYVITFAPGTVKVLPRAEECVDANCYPDNKLYRVEREIADGTIGKLGQTLGATLLAPATPHAAQQ